MAEADAPTTGAAGEEKPPEGENKPPAAAAAETAGKTDADIEAIAAKAENPDAVRNALTAERTAAKEARERADALAAEVQTYKDRDKTEQERLEERATTAEGRAEKSEAKLLRFEVATKKKLPLELADRLQGKNKTELEADADRLLELVKPNGKPEGDADGGKGEGGGGQTFNDLMRATARR